MKTVDCKRCGAPIIWTTTRKSKRMPIDAEPVSKGEFIIEDEDKDGSPNVVWIGERDKYTGERYTSHFKTCSANSETCSANSEREDPQ